MTTVVVGFEDVDALSTGLRLSGYDTRTGNSGFLNNGFFSHMQDALAVDGLLYFSLFNENSGGELWVSDGTPGGTQLVKEIRSGGGLGSDPFGFFELNNKLYFWANDGTTGNELWRSDGTGAGTVQVKDIRAGAQGSLEANLDGALVVHSDRPATANNVGYVSVLVSSNTFDMFRTDGNGPGTLSFTAASGFAVPAGESGAAPVAVLHGELLFATQQAGGGGNLYITDGTKDGTRLAKFFAGSNDVGGGPGFGGAVLGRQLILPASETGAGTEIWATDGTVAGTILLKDIIPGSSPDFQGTQFPHSSQPRELTVSGRNVFFTAQMNPGNFDTVDFFENRALWKTDGTAAGTVMVKDIRVATSFDDDDGTSRLVDVNGVLFFGADDGTHGFELWRSDGTTAGTFMVKDLDPGFDEGAVPGLFGGLTNVNGALYFYGLASDHVNHDLYKSDGTAAGTVPVVFNVNPFVPISFVPSTNIFLQSNVTGQVIFTETNAPGELTFGAWTDATGPEWHARAVGNLNAGPGLDEVIVQNDQEGIIYFASRDTGSLVWGVVGNGNVPGWTVIDAADIMGKQSDSPIIQENITGTIFYADMTGGQFHSWKVVNTALTFEWKAIGAADITGDGFADVVVQNQVTGATVYADMRDGVFRDWGSVVSSLDSVWQARAVGDVTGDGYADVIFQNQNDGVTYYADMEKGAFARWGVVAAAITPELVAQDAVDIDHDGDTEVIFQNTIDGSAFYAIANGTGLHEPAWRLVAIGIDTEWVVA